MRNRIVEYRQGIVRIALVVLGCALIGAREPVESTTRPLILLGDRDYPPLTFLRNGAPTGIDIDIAAAISNTLGRDVRVILMDWAAAQEKVLHGEAEGVLSMSVSAERRPWFDFSDAMATHEFGLFVTRGSQAIYDARDLDGKRIGVTQGGPPRRLLESRPGVSLVFIRNYEDRFQRLTAGTIDAVAADRWVGSYILEREHVSNVVATGEPFAAAAGTIAVKKGNTEVLNAINHAVREIKANGTLDTIQDRWRSREMLFVSRQRIDRLLTLAGIAALVLLLLTMAIWLFTVTRQIRARRVAECALIEGERRLRELLTKAETELAERKEVERQLRLLAHALQSASDCVCITDTADHILYVNEAFLRTYEYEPTELMGQHISMVRSDNDPDIVEGILDATKTEGWRGLLWNRSKTGRIFPVSLATSVVHDEEGTIVAAVGVARDMTKEMADEEALRRTEVRYREVVENANDIIFTVDPEGYCLSMNRAGRQMSGYTAEDGRGIHLAHIVAPEHAAYAARQLQRVLDGEVVPTFELQILSKEGRRLTLELNVRQLQGDGGRSGVQGIARDVTARKELEEQLRQSQKMEAIGRLAGGIAHDFNNLLTVVVGYFELLTAALPPDSPLRGDVDEIRRAASSAGSLTRQLLIFSRKDVVQTELLDLNEIVDHLERMLRRIVGEDIDFIVRQARDLGCIKADAGQIEQVIMNLVVNARDAMPEGGTLTVETAVVEIDEDRVRSQPGSKAGIFARLTIEDTGHGMTPDVQAQIFTPFFTIKGPSTGTGLGLATVHGIVQQAGGWIDVASAPGKGARFLIYLPRFAPPALFTAGAQAASHAVPVASGTILFVEDDESIRALGARTLRQQGFTVLTARHATEALQLVDSLDRAVDLLLTDIVMPGMSGRELASLLQQSRPELKVLYTSGYTDDSVAIRDMRVNGSAFIQKPYSPDVLVRSVRTVLSGS